MKTKKAAQTRKSMEASNIEKRIENDGFVNATVSIYDEMIFLEKDKEEKRIAFIHAEADYNKKREQLGQVLEYAIKNEFSFLSAHFPVVRVPYKADILEITKYDHSNDSINAEIVKFTIPPFK